MRICGIDCLRALIPALVAAWPGCSDEPPAWDGAFDTPVVRPEHSRPDFRRDTFINLNTRWDFAYDREDTGLDARWYERDDVWTDEIQLPYAWEAPLAGLVSAQTPYSPLKTMNAATYRGVAWYRLQLPGRLPRDEGLAWHLVLGAVDFAASVYVDGELAVEHEGGYDPFSVRLSDAASTIVIRVEDLTELAGHVQPVGKQGDAWYTRTSGIWQTVYLEQRPRVYLESLRVVPDPDNGRLLVSVTLNEAASGTVSLEARLDDKTAGTATTTFTSAASAQLTLPLSPIARWDVESPTLYDLDVRVRADREQEDLVHSYFGLRTVSTDWVPGHSPSDTQDPHQQHKAFFVNGKPRYLRCVLDQSYFPDGVYTAPSLAAIRADLQAAKSYGLNCIRLHIKPDEPVKYRLLDELGFYVVYDLPSLSIQAKNTPGFAGRQQFERALRRAITRDANHPSIILWVVFNENWGLGTTGSLLALDPIGENPEIQGWVRQMVKLVRELDPSRPVEDNSAGGIVGQYEHVDTDSNSFHLYNTDIAEWRVQVEEQADLTFPGSTANFVGGATQDGDPWWNSECSAKLTLDTDEPAVFCRLFGMFNELRRTPKLVGWTLTQLTDLEWETGGLLAYDRSTKADQCARHGVALADVMGDDAVIFDWLPGHQLKPSESVQVPLLFSRWSTASPATLTLTLRWGDDPSSAPVTFTAQPYQATSIANASVTAPASPGKHTLVAEVKDKAGERVCASWLEVVVAP
jgi:beta-galactosidase/beta-glucuronidase